MLNDKWLEQMRANGRTQIGLSLSIPIFNAMRTKNQVRISELSIKNQEYAINKAEKSLRKEIQQAFYNALAAEQKYLASKETLKPPAWLTPSPRKATRPDERHYLSLMKVKTAFLNLKARCCKQNMTIFTELKY